MHSLDILTLIVSFLIALLVCCMLLALTRLGATLKLIRLPPSPPHPPQTYLPRTRLSNSPHARYGYLTTQPSLHHTSHFSTQIMLPLPRATPTMLHTAVNKHNATVPPPAPGVASKQQSLGSAFGRNGSNQNIAPRPLASATKQNGAGKSGLGNFSLGSYNQGTKRTSSGLAKTLSSQGDTFSYPSLSMASTEKENDFAAMRNAPPGASNTVLATALFDEDDFDSDIDLEMEDPATKGIVTYPSLPKIDSSESADSGYQSRPPTTQQRLELDSSQPILWSSSPLEHFKTPQKPEKLPPRSRRAFLPWSHNQQQANLQQAQDQIEEEDKEDVAETPRPTKRQSTEVKPAPVATPKPKNDYLWNTTASGLKQQQKNLREMHKKQSEKNDVSVDDLKDAVKKRKKNTVHRIFLSEEQQNVLNLVTEYKKSVFFTGSAGTLVHVQSTCIY